MMSIDINYDVIIMVADISKNHVKNMFMPMDVV